MSAWSLGRDGGASTTLDGEGKLNGFADRVTKWIPADVIAFYTAAITFLKIESPNPNPSWLLLGLGAGLALALPLIAARRTRKTIGKRDFALAVTAVLAFGIWSLVVPESGWYSWHLVSGHPGWVAVIAALGGILFGGNAERALPAR